MPEEERMGKNKNKETGLKKTDKKETKKIPWLSDSSW